MKTVQALQREIMEAREQLDGFLAENSDHTFRPEVAIELQGKIEALSLEIERLSA